MRQDKDLYKRAFCDYFLEFQCGFGTWKIFFTCFGLVVLVYSYHILMNETLIDGMKKNWLVGIPLFFALFSGIVHQVSLPFMMYLVPMSKQDREDYIQKLLYIKIGIPLLVAFFCDLVAIFLGQLSLYLFILQIFSVFIISYIFGTLNDGRLIGKVRGSQENFVIIPLLLGCHLACIMFVFCIDFINMQKFFIILAVLVCIFVPMICWINKKWRSIRSNFADYQLIVKAEEKDFRRRGLSNADYH